jgi:RNA polymerase sigma-70 factor (ECF subfamily)
VSGEVSLSLVWHEGRRTDSNPPADGPAFDPDGVALSAMAAGDPAGLGELFNRHAAALMTYLLTILRDRQAAEDVLQETLIAVWRGAGGFAGRSSTRTWLFAIARRRAATALRRSGAGLADRTVELPDDQPGAAPGPEELVMRRADVDRVGRAARTLSPAHREILLLACVHDMTGTEIGEILGVPTGTVKSRLARARQALVRALAGDAGGEMDGSD